MSPTVHELRNEIRASVGRFERETAAQFTKEELARLANEVGYAVDPGMPPSKSQMRAGIRWKAGLSETEDDADTSSFVKAELQELAAALDESATETTGGE